MIAEKKIYEKIISNMFSDAIEVTFWDGDHRIFGEGTPKVRLIFNEPFSKIEAINDIELAFCEAYMDGKVEIDGSIQEFVESMFKKIMSSGHYKPKNVLKGKIVHTLGTNKKDIHHHYDIGNDFYKLWLDKNMLYSCAYFRNMDDSIDVAEQQKVHYTLNKLCINPGDTLLDIGCGWGNLIFTAAKEYGATAKGITLSEEQFKYVSKKILDEGLEGKVSVELTNYKDLKGQKFDRIVSVGMIEHVGKKNLPLYFEDVRRLLKPSGISLAHSITVPFGGGTNSFLNKYIFPGGYVPSIKELITTACDYGFYILDVESLRRHYGKTLECWTENFENALPEISKTKDERFIRMWRLYLESCAAAFNTGRTDIHQILISKGPNNAMPWTRDYMQLR